MVYFPRIYQHKTLLICMRDQVLVKCLLELLYLAPGDHNIHVTLGTVVRITDLV